MSSQSGFLRNPVLPDSFKIMGTKTFPGSALNEFKYWTLRQTGGYQPALEIEADLKNTGEYIKVYPRFKEKNRTISDPKSFSTQPRIKDFSGTSIKLQYTPLEEIQVESLYWTPDADVLCGEFVLNNPGNKERRITLDLVYYLQIPQGSAFSHLEYGGKDLLYGQTEDQHTICFVSGGPSPDTGSFPCLSSHLTLEPGSEIKLRWIIIQAVSKEAGLEILEKVILFSWKDEISRENITLQDQLIISTGVVDWDLALRYSQCQADNYLTSLETKSPDSKSQEISPLKGLLLSSALYPLKPIKIQKLLNCVFPPEFSNNSEHNKDNSQVNKYPEYPFSGELIWQIQQDHDLGDQLISLLQSIESRISLWFEKEFDRDDDGIPEIDPSYFFKLWGDLYSHHIDPGKKIGPNPHLETPGLSALLVNEINKLRDLSLLTSFTSSLSSSNETRDRLINHIKSSWEGASNIYQARDSDSHLLIDGQVLSEGLNIGFNTIGSTFSQPSRVGISLRSNITPPHMPDLKLMIHGRDQNGEYRIEGISPFQIHWDQMTGWAYSETIYSRLEYILIQGADEVMANVLLPGSTREDISLLFPLFGEIPDQELAEILINDTITKPDKFWSPFGIRSFLESGQGAIHLPWNYLIIQGLINYGYKIIAADLFSRIMTAVGTNFRTNGNLSDRIDSTTGKGLGPQLNGEGLIPIRLFLQIAGIQITSHQELIIKDEYPFNFPLRLKYRGAEIVRNAKKSLISIPGNKTIHHKGSKEIRIILN